MLGLRCRLQQPPGESRGFQVTPPDREQQGKKAFVCRIGWHSLQADFPGGIDRCTRCGKEWKLHTVAIPHWLAKLLRPWR